MRKVFSLMLLLATILTFTACGDDKEDEPQPNYPSIVGTWSRTVSQEQIGNGTMTIKQKQVFKSNNTAQGIAEVYLNSDLYQSKTFDYTYTYDGKTLTMKSTSSGETETFKVTISGNTLTQVGDEGTFVFYKE